MIMQLAIHTVDRIVEAANKPIVVVVPAGGSLMIEARVLNRDAGFVRADQPVALKPEAFPFTRNGTMRDRAEKNEAVRGRSAIDDLNCEGGEEAIQSRASAAYDSFTIRLAA